MDESRRDVHFRGFALVADLLDAAELVELCSALSSVHETDAVRKKAGVYAIRNLLDVVPAVAALARSAKLIHLASLALGQDAFPVRGTLFNKTPDANWLVPWHQDLTICVKERLDVTGYGPWTVKAGLPHVQPPVAVLEAMLAVRVHLDDCHERNGALRVLPGTHKSGRLTANAIELAQRNGTAPVTCSVGRGGAVLMKPLLLHASSAAEEPSHRRVIHIDYAACQLSGGLEWFSE